MTSPRLSKEEFAASLQRGQGRALIYVRKYGLEDVADLVLEACLHDQAYDPQCEDSRAQWLLQMFYDTPEYERFSQAIISALANEKEIWDLQQLSELAAHMAERGHEEAHLALRSRVLQQAAGTGDNWVGSNDLVRLEGVVAVVQLARLYGNQLNQDSELDPPPLDQLYEDEVPIQARDILQRLSEVDPEIKAYWDYNVRYEARRSNNLNSKEKRRERTRQLFPLQKIMDDASIGFGKYAGQYMSFGRVATPDELETVFKRLLVEPDEQACIRLLWVFRRVELPRIDPRLWQFAVSKNEQLRDAAMVALAQKQDQSIGEFARDILRRGDFKSTDSEVLGLFINNYKQEDGGLIVSVLNRIQPDPISAHSLGLNILHICDVNQPPELLEALKWIYEVNPCTICRKDAVEHMRALRQLEPEMIEECLNDADEDIQRIAREMRGSGAQV